MESIFRNQWLQSNYNNIPNIESKPMNSHEQDFYFRLLNDGWFQDLLSLFNIDPWSGPALLEISGSLRFEVMTKLRMQFNAVCMRQNGDWRTRHTGHGVESRCAGRRSEERLEIVVGATFALLLLRGRLLSWSGGDSIFGRLLFAATRSVPVHAIARTRGAGASCASRSCSRYCSCRSAAACSLCA